MPFAVDATCDFGSPAAPVTATMELSVGHDTHFLQFCHVPDAIAGTANPELLGSMERGEIKKRCWLLKKGNEGRMKTYIQMVDMLRSPDEKSVPFGIVGYKLQKPGKDVSATMDLWKLLFKCGKLFSCA